MPPRRTPKGGSPSPGSRREAKHGGNKNGKKEGTSGSSFFTWFMVIALLGVWTSVAVVWFELVDYEDVLGKLGIYDADGDGDFDVEDAKILLGLKEKSVTEQPAVRDTEEVIQPVEEQHVTAEHRSIREPEPDDEVDSLLHDVLDSQLEHESETEEEHAQEEGNFHETGENNEIRDVPVIEEEYNEEKGNKIPEILEKHKSLQEESVNDYEEEGPDVDDTPVTYEYHSNLEENVDQPEGTEDTEFNLEDALDHNPEDTEFNLEDALDHNQEDTEFNLEDALDHNPETFSEDTEHQDYANEHDLESEDLIETQEADGEPLTEHYDENIQDTADSYTDSSDSLPEHSEPVDDKEYVEDHVAAEPREIEIPVVAEDYTNDELVDT